MPEPCSSGRPAGRTLASRPAIAGAAIALALAAALPTAAFAQYKWVGADGTVTYGDRPPPGARMLGQPGASAGARPEAAASAGQRSAAALPYELRTASQRHPVTLYVAADCQPCEQARQHLVRRGIPHQAREVRTQRDADAFTALGFASLSFPAVSIGRDRLVGFEPAGWDRMLDAAGYPKESKLPRDWQLAGPEPLTQPEPAVVTLQAGPPGAAGNAPESAAPVASAAPVPRERRRAAASEPEPAPSIRF
ncbi:glutaredoxin family protein [Burkholderiaceae bacterium FT117]|uniref:DUF4124 domain-containing protein n=1 Tax=Zeimonas sediminis TaxID=2944268 RepID=UPI0023430D6A|nr:DUF4124 domain-containing protein [Zeimonas sediminis]MCM5571983.1 glutaredoxin family protein [Zeimonas sediminis]